MRTPNYLEQLENDNLVFLCIGTDRSTGDSFGPLIGTMLTELGYSNVIGTLEDPCHAVNLSEKLKEIPKKKKVIAIDASLGAVASVGRINFGKGPIKPGAGVGRDLGSVGDYHIKGIVNVGGFMEYFVLQNTRLSLVMKMAKQVVQEITKSLPLQIAYGEVAVTKEDGVDVC